MKTFREIQVLTDKAATGYSDPQNVENFDHVGLTLVGSNTASLTVKVQISQQDTKPDFTAAASPTNRWSYVQIKALIDGSTVAGGTGVVFAADGVQHYELNTNGVRWVNVQVSAYTSGKLNAWIKGFAIDEDA